MFSVIYIPNTSRVPVRRKTLQRKNGKISEHLEKFIEEHQEKEHNEYMAIKIELGEAVSVKLEKSDLV